VNTQKPTLPPTPPSTPQPLPPSPEDTADGDNLHDDLTTLDDILSGPAPSGDPCPHCGGPDCPGGDDDPCVQAWRDELEEMRWEDELREMAAEQCGDPANEDEVAQ
jgi:hypothetical protein